MNKVEFTRVLAVIKTAYPNGMIPEKKDEVNVWFEMLGGLDYELCMGTVKDHIMNNQFPPTIAAIRKGCAKEEGCRINEDGTIDI